MRVEEYTTELVGVGFAVVGSDIPCYSDQVDYLCDPIEMSLTTRSDNAGNEYPAGDSLDTLLKLSQIDSNSRGTGDEDIEFESLFAKIIRGEHPNWQLGEFDVRFGEISLWYGNIKTQSTGSITICTPRNLQLTFRTTRTRLGFDPVYHVRIQHDEQGRHKCTEVLEDLGYMRRLISFKTEDLSEGVEFHSHQTDHSPNHDRQNIHVTEFIGM